MIERWLEERRRGLEQSEEAVRGFVEGVVSGAVTRAQAAAWLAFVAIRGMTRAETVALTRAMTESGERLAWEGIAGRCLDKHSTGGVGDKVSLVLAPVWAAMGHHVPMLSGRGLGITGGTLDKLESIPGYRTDLGTEELGEVLASCGCFISGQTERLAPADRILYALRDETGTVPSIPLITASILSKKLAEGIEELVLDVKFGSGAFMGTRAEGEALATSLREVGEGAGLRMRVHLSPMDEPLGEAVGNALEVEEAERCLRGGGPRDLRALVCTLSGAPERAAAVLDDGRALARWEAMVAAQGGRLADRTRADEVREEEIRAPRSGRLVRFDAQAVGRAAFLLGAGRRRAEDPVHPDVGIVIGVRGGEDLRAGQPVARLLHAAGRGLDEARATLVNGLRFAEDAREDERPGG